MPSQAYIRTKAESEYLRIYGTKPQFNAHWTDFYNGFVAGYKEDR